MFFFKNSVAGALLFLSAAAIADTSSATDTFWQQKLQFSFALGWSYLQTPDTTIEISPYETDELQTTRSSNNAIWKIGVGYPMSQYRWSDAGPSHDIFTELNLYHTNGTLRGDAWQFQDEQFDNYSFRAPISSTRLMLDIKPELLSGPRWQAYPIAGLGVAWNKMSYNETANNNVDTDSTLSLANATAINFAYELGAGVHTKINEHLSASLEYLFTDLGTVSPSNQGNNNTALTTPPKFTVQDQNLMLGLIWTL